jgi:hypothetical protein
VVLLVFDNAFASLFDVIITSASVLHMVGAAMPMRQRNLHHGATAFAPLSLAVFHRRVTPRHCRPPSLWHCRVGIGPPRHRKQIAFHLLRHPSTDLRREFLRFVCPFGETRVK